MGIPHIVLVFFFFNDTATTEIYTLSLHDALPISSPPNHHSIHVPSSAHVRPHAAYSNCPKICTESLELGRLTLGKYLRKESLALGFNRQPHHRCQTRARRQFRVQESCRTAPESKSGKRLNALSGELRTMHNLRKWAGFESSDSREM